MRNFIPIMAGLSLFINVSAQAATIAVNTTSANASDPTLCTLRAAMTAANTNQAVGGCPAGQGVDTITLEKDATYTLTEVDNAAAVHLGLPIITEPLIIEGNGATIIRDPNAPEFGFITTLADLTLNDLKLKNSTGVLNQHPVLVGGNAKLTINNCAIRNNDSWGVVATENGSFVINNSLLANNSYGAAVASTVTPSKITNTTMTGNGGGVGVINGSITVEGSTIVGNTNTCGAICISSSFNTVTLINTIVAKNPINCGFGAVVDGGYNFIDNNTCGLHSGTTIVGPDPMLDTLKNNGGFTETMAPLPGSPVISAGGACTSTTDQRLAPRPGIGKTNCDIGAYETGLPKLALDTPSDGKLDFGSVKIGNNSQSILTVKNVGNQKIDSFTYNITGANAADFQAITPDLTALSASSYRDITLKYTPSSQTSNATFTLTANNGQNNVLSVPLTGQGVSVEVPPTAQIAAIITLAKTLDGTGKNMNVRSAEKAVFLLMLKTASNAIQKNQMIKACVILKDANKLVDGLPRPPDLVRGTNAGEVSTDIVNLIKSLGCAIPSPTDTDE